MENTGGEHVSKLKKWFRFVRGMGSPEVLELIRFFDLYNWF